MNIHLIGIGGVGMAALAVLLKHRGHRVTGCDLHRSPRTDALVAQGVAVFEGHDPAHLADSDEVVVTPAVAAQNPEFAAARARGAVRYRGDVLAALVSDAADSVAVCGSHGKTTTATFVAKLLRALGESVEWAIGGETGEFPVAGGTAGGVLVVEADESDGTLANYRAKTLVVNRCDYDHPDHFKTPEAYFACYDAARAKAGDVVESETLAPLSELEALSAYRALAAHNRRNARAAVEVALRRGHPLAAVLAALPEAVAALPDRRFQKIWPAVGVTDGAPSAPTVYTDYAHHPTEMRCAVEMARAVCRGRLVVLFQPHRHSRTKALLGEFPSAFAGADEVVLCPTYAAFEPPVEGGDIADLYAVCRAGGLPVVLARTLGEAWEHARNTTGAADVVLLLGAGDIISLVPRIRRELGDPAFAPAMRRVWIGQGTNTVKGDLKADVEYVRTKGPADRPGASLGIPWMAGIPGTVGGWVKMNAGAFGHSISEALEAVKVDGVWRAASDCGFAYRHSELTGEIEDVRLRPEFAAPVAAAEGRTAADYLARRKRFPAGTKGSVFKNPPGDFAGRLLESVGAKELRVGGCRVWSDHATVIVAGEGASDSDFIALARLMANRVFFRLGVRLEPEVRGLDIG